MDEIKIAVLKQLNLQNDKYKERENIVTISATVLVVSTIAIGSTMHLLTKP
jgi:hypothetical protein